jgi:hypothetical protein
MPDFAEPDAARASNGLLVVFQLLTRRYSRRRRITEWGFYAPHRLHLTWRGPGPSLRVDAPPTPHYFFNSAYTAVIAALYRSYERWLYPPK